MLGTEAGPVITTGADPVTEETPEFAHLTAFDPVEVRTWPAVPQELSLSIIPAPGLIALVLLPVNQLSEPEKPIASWQLPVAEVKVTPQPIATL
jgi:hypothetical protein